MWITPSGHRPSLLESRPSLGMASCLRCFVFPRINSQGGTLMTLQIAHLKTRDSAPCPHPFSRRDRNRGEGRVGVVLTSTKMQPKLTSIPIGQVVGC